MLELRYIRENVDKVREYLKNRNSDFDLDSLIRLDEDRRNILQEVEVLKKERNESSSLIGKYKQEGKDATELLNRMQEVSAKIKELVQKVAEIEEKQKVLTYTIPTNYMNQLQLGKMKTTMLKLENGELQENLILSQNLMMNWELILEF